MGKSNRIRANRVDRQVKTLNTKTKKKGMPSWLMTLITLVVTFAIVLSVAFLLLTNNGVFNRMSKTVSTEHYKVDANMLSYFFYTQYQNFEQQYSSYMSNFSLDTKKSLKDQRFGGPEGDTNTYYDTMILGEFEGTWFDYMMKQTVDSVKSILVYCEEAHVRGLELGEEDYKQIDASLTALSSTAATYNYTLDAYISAVYGSGVKETDVRRAMEYSALATKCMSVLSDELEAAINGGRIDAKYAEKANDFNKIDYSYYTFKVNYDEVAKEVLGQNYTDAELKAKDAEILKAYQDAVAEAKANAEKIKAMTDVAAVNRFVLEYVATEEFEKAYKQQTIKDEDKVSDEDLKAIKEALIKEVVDEILAGKEEGAKASTEGENDATAYGKTITKAFAGQLNTMKSSTFSATLSAKKSYVKENVGYTANDSFSTWAFAAERAKGDTTVIVEGDGKDEGEVKKTSGYSYVSAYFLSEKAYKDQEKSRNVAYMLFTDETTAKAAVQKLMDQGATSDKAAFEAIAQELAPEANTSIENYTKGTLGNDTFDEWLFDGETKVGTYSAAPLKLDSSTYCVAIYYGEGQENWYVDVKKAILTEDFEAKYDTMVEAYPVTVKDKALNKVDA